MKPRKWVTPWACCPAVTSFNEAAAMKPRKSAGHPRSWRGMPRGFNEAAAMKPRKYSSTGAPASSDVCYNEAAAMKPRK